MIKMLYQAYQANEHVLALIRLLAEATRGFLSQPWQFVRDNPFLRGAAAACEVVSRSGIRHQRPAFGFTETVIGGRAVAIREEAVISIPSARADPERRRASASCSRRRR